MIDCSIVIVSWNVAELLAACLDSIIASPVTINERRGGLPSVEIIVVDSGSDDNSVQMVRERYPMVKLFAYDENIGFVKANNIGFQHAQGRYIYMLNPDTELIGNALNQQIMYLDINPPVGIIGAHTLNTDGTTQSSRRRFPTKAIAFFESTWLQPIAPQSLLDAYYIIAPPDHAVIDVDWVQGSAMMVRREIYDSLGGLDDNLVMYYEETDWCKRAKDAGWRVVYLGTAQIIHHGGKSSEQVSAFKHIAFQQSKIYYFRKYHGRGFAALLYAFLMFNYVWQIAEESIKAMIGHKRQMRQERVKVYWQVIRSGFKVS